MGVVTSGAGGRVRAYSASGEYVTEFGRPGEVIRGLDTGDLDGDGKVEVAFHYHRWNRVAAYTMPLRKMLWAVDGGNLGTGQISKERHGNRELWVADLDGDGRPEIIRSGGNPMTGYAIEALSSDGGSVWLAPLPSRSDSFREPMIRVVSLGDRSAVLALFGREIYLFDSSGREIRRFEMKHPGFTDMAVHRAGNVSEVLFASAPGNDRDLYLFRTDPEGLDTLAKLDRPGRLRAYSGAIAELLADLKKKPTSTGRTYTLWVGAGGTSAKEIPGMARNLSRYQERHPFRNIRHGVTWAAHQTEPIPHFPETHGFKQGEALPGEEIIERVRTFEREQLYFKMNVGHGTDPYLSLDTLEKIFQSAPNYLVGVQVSEEHQHLWPVVGIERILHYLQHYVAPLLELCLKYDKKLFMEEKMGFWAAVPATRSFFDLYFASGKFGNTLVMAVEESHSRAPELNFCARAGLWRAGLIKEWEATLIKDELRWTSTYEYGSLLDEGGPYFREALAAVAAGATYVTFKFSTISPGNRDLHGLSDGRFHYLPKGFEARLPLMYLLGTGLLEAPEPEKVVGFSPVVFRFAEPHPAFLEGLWINRLVSDENWRALFGTTGWGMTTSQDEYIMKHLAGANRHFGQFIPETPFGLPLIMPARAPLPPGFTGVVTDGVHLVRGERKVSGAAATEEIIQTFEDAARKLPFRIEGCYWMAHRKDADGKILRLLLVDPNWLNPKKMDIAIHVQNGRALSVTDLLSDRPLELLEEGKKFKATIPEGLFRILEVRLE
jgi:hypothetical protein